MNPGFSPNRPRRTSASGRWAPYARLPGENARWRRPGTWTRAGVRLIVIVMTLLTADIDDAKANTRIAIVQSSTLQPFGDARRGIEAALAEAGFSPGPDCVIEVMVVEGGEAGASETAITDYVRRNDPDLVILIGTLAARLALSSFPDQPMAFCMTSREEQNQLLGPAIRASGVLLDIPPATQFDLLEQIQPNVERLGIIYDDQRSSFEASAARQEALSRGWSVIDAPIDSHSEVPAAMNRLMKNAQALLLIPSERVLGQAIVSRLFHQAIINRVLIFGPSRSHVRLGALFAVTPNWTSVGKQLGEMVTPHLEKETAIQRIPARGPDDFALRVNLRIRELLELEIPPEWAGKTELYRP